MNLDELLRLRDEMIREFVRTTEASETFEEAEERLKEFCTDKFYTIETEEDMDVLNYFEKLVTIIIKCAYNKDTTEDEQVLDEIIKKYKEVQ